MYIISECQIYLIGTYKVALWLQFLPRDAYA